MMGQKDQSRSSKLFYILDLEKEMPADHILRKIDAVLDLSFLYEKVKGLYGYNGNESIDPVVIFKIWLMGYLFGIPSERKLVGEIRLNLGYRWFLGYDYDDAVPTHSVLSKARRRFGQETRMSAYAFFGRCLNIWFGGARRLDWWEGRQFLWIPQLFRRMPLWILLCR